MIHTSAFDARALFRGLLFVVVTAPLLSGCLEDEEEIAAGELDNPEAEVANDLRGSVGDGPIIGAILTIRDKNGEVVQISQSDQVANYDIQVKLKGKYYPLQIDATGGRDLVTGTDPDFTLTAVVLKPSKRTVTNLNPFTTLIVETARGMPGGISDTNIAAARQAVLKQLNVGLDTGVIGDPMGELITASNIAIIVKASETLGEIIRRTRDTLISTGTNVNGNDIIRALAADLIDGMLDGQGATETSPRISATTTIVSAKVLVESLSNNLRVNGFHAASAMDTAIKLVISSAKSSTDDVPITAQMLTQARVAVDAAMAISNDPSLQDLKGKLTQLVAQMLPGEVEQSLPDGSSQAVDAAITRIAQGVAADINAVNTVVRNGGGSSGLPRNSAPTISGTAATSVAVGQNYSFTPTASDPDADALTFGIKNRPAWANFNTTNGKLAGTPGGTDTGTTTGVVISVSDGSMTSSLPAFDVTVVPVATGSATLSWTAPTKNADGTSLTDLAGYRIYYGQQSGNYSNVVDVPNPGVTTYVLENLAAATWYFSVTAYDKSRNESDRSNEAKKLISQ